MTGQKSLVVFLSQWGGYAILLVSSVIVARTLGPDKVGQMAFSMSAIGIFFMITSLGLPFAHQKRLAEGMDPGLCIATYGTFSLLLNTLVIVISLVCYPILKPLLGDHEAQVAFFFFLVFQSLYNIGQVFIYGFYGQQQFVKAATMTMAARLTRLIALGAILIFYPSLIAAGACFALEGLVYVGSGIFLSGILNNIRWPTCQSFESYWSYAKPLALISPLGVLGENLDRVVLGSRYEVGSVGYYNIALNLFEAIKSLPSAVVSTLFPNITKEFSKTGVSGLKNAFVGVQRKLMMITTPVAVLVIYWADQIILTLYGQSFAPSAAVLKVLMGAFLFISYTSSYHNIVYATEEHKIFLWLSPISQGLFALALWILCSKSLGLGPIGAALAIGVPYYVSFPFVLSCVKKKIGVDYPTSWLLYVAAGAIMWALTALLTQFVGGGILLKVIWSLVGLGSYAGFLFIVHEISGQDLTYFLYVFNPSKFMNYLKSEFR